ncbi:MAG: GNAT family N-acetyltransferase [Catenulispora sp.]|nr:GNAT family N-acetyltransferase [Catenulispora sp.]
MSTPHHEYPRGPRLSLREFRPDDLLAWQRIAGDPRVAAHTPWPALATPDTAGAWLAETARMAQATPRRSFYLGLEYGDLIGAAGGDLIGTATLDILSFPHRQGEIGVYLRPDRWAEGLGTEAARLLLELAFSRLELHRVQATFDPRNLPGLRVAEHIKMRPEGILLDRYLIAGQWQDRAMYAITLPEWRGLGRGQHVTFEGTAEEPLIGSPRSEEQPPADGPPSGAEPQSAPASPNPQPSPNPPNPQTPPNPPAGDEPQPGEEPDPESTEPVTAPEEPLVGGRFAGDPAAGEPTERQVLTAQIVTRQIEVVEILPREP